MRTFRALASIIIVSLLVCATAAMASPGLTGKVIETMDSGGYTYIQIENKAGKSWFAIPQASVKKGEKVTFLPGSPMPNFTSKTLGRTFDMIIFSPGLAN